MRAFIRAQCARTGAGVMAAGEPSSKRRKGAGGKKMEAAAAAPPAAAATLELPRVGFGTFKMKGEECSEAVGAALKAGYRLIDTAQIYGNEKEVGAALKASGVPREEVFVTTKIWRSSHGYDRCKASFKKSLRALGLEYVDMVLIHWPGCKTGWPLKKGTTCPPDWTPAMRQETYRCLEELVGEGTVRYIGVSNYTVRHLKELLPNAKVKPHVLQCEFHPRLVQTELLKFCTEHGIIFQAYSSLGSGESPTAHEEMMGLPAVTDAAAAHEVSAAQVLLKWAVQKGCYVLPKSKTPARMATNRQLDGFELTADEMARIDECNEDRYVTWKGVDRESVE